MLRLFLAAASAPPQELAGDAHLDDERFAVVRAFLAYDLIGGSALGVALGEFLESALVVVPADLAPLDLDLFIQRMNL